MSVAFGAAEGAGHLNVVIVGWNDSTSTIQSITDTEGNTYVSAVGPVTNAGNATQRIYYAKNVTSGSDTVTVAFNTTVNYPNVRVLEYSGIDTVNPFDVGVSGSGSGLSQSSGSVTTTNASDLLVASNYIADFTTASDPNYTQRFITTGGELVEDRVVSSTGSYSAASTQGAAGFWVMQLVAFRAAGTGDTQAPTAPTGLTATVASSSQINLNWSASSDNVGVAGYRVERCQGASCSTFAQIGTPTATSYSDSGLTASTAYSYRVRAVDAAGNASTYSSTVSASTSAAADTTPPTAPSGLGATVASSSQINLSWTASTDNIGVTGYRVERCQGASCTTFAQIGTPTATTYNDSGLTASTAYSYRVRAVDAAGNASAYSSTVSASTSAAADTTPPTAPSGLGTAVASSSQINLSWTASTDNVGVTGYRVERCQGASCSTFAQIGTPTTTTYSDSGLTASTAYSYRVRAVDAAGNASAYSSTVSASTSAAADTTPPTAPSGLGTTVASSSQINLSWTASTDNVGVAGYRVESCQGASCSTFTQIGTPATNSFSATGLSASTSYSFRVRAVDAAGNLSAYSSTATASTPAASIAYVQGTSQNPNSGSTVSVALGTVEGAGHLNVVIVGWNSSTSSVQSVTDTRGNTYVAAVGPVTNSGNATQLVYYAKNIAAGSDTVTVTFSTTVNYPNVRVLEYSGVDTVNPFDVGVSGSGSGLTQNSGSLTTTNANDLLVASNYVADATTASDASYTQRFITAGGELVEDRLVSSTGSYSATSTQGVAGFWVMQLAAFRAAGSGGGDTQAPSAPTSPAATVVSSSQINLSWTASTDNVGVTGYAVESCVGTSCATFAQIGTGTATTYSATGLTASSSYSFRVRATDAAGNLSNYSTTVSATTSSAADTTPPSAPSGLAATAISNSQINLSWVASSDNVGVTGYQIESCQGSSCSNFAQVGTSTTTSFSASALAATTSYTFRVRATDAASNLSTYSNSANATTPAAGGGGSICD